MICKIISNFVYMSLFLLVQKDSICKGYWVRNILESANKEIFSREYRYWVAFFLCANKELLYMQLYDKSFEYRK